MESGGLGGFGGGRERGEGSDAPDYSGFGGGGPGYGNVQDMLDREIDRVNRANDLIDLANERAQERPGRFGAISIAPARTDYAGNIFGFVRGLMNAFPGLLPGLGPVPGMAISLANIASMKARGYSDEEIDRAFGIGAMSMVPGFTTAMAIGKGAQKAARAMGATGGPQATFGDQPASPGLGGVRDVDPYGDTTKFDRSQILADAKREALRARLYGGA